MGDAEIIPIGTRGRPGRGTGRDKPSSATRDLAHGGRPPGGGPDASRPGTEDAPPRTPDADPRPDLDGDGEVEVVLDPAPAAPRPPSRTADRHPLGNLGVGELWSAAQQAAREVFGDDWEPRLAHLLAFLRRRVTGEYEVDDFGFDPELTERFLIALVRPIAHHWFRVEVRGLENIPVDGGALVVSNHSGTVPVDGVMTMAVVNEHTGRFLRPLGADLVFRLPFVSSLARKGGTTLACAADAERLLRAGELVGVWPEGFKGIGKPYSERYKLQRFGRGGFVSAALRTGVPIVPLSVVGAEEIYPLIGNVPALARLLGVPYLPITPLFPWLGPLGMVPLPSKWLMEFGEPVRTDAYEPGAADDPMLVFNVTDQVRETIQQTLYSLLMDRPSVFG